MFSASHGTRRPTSRSRKMVLLLANRGKDSSNKVQDNNNNDTRKHGRRRMMRYCTVPGVPGPAVAVAVAAAVAKKLVILIKKNDKMKPARGP